MKKTQDQSIKTTIIAGFTILAVIQILGFWWLANLGVQRTGEVIQSQRSLISK